jgi:molybdopterin synthase catalytic subunit
MFDIVDAPFDMATLVAAVSESGSGGLVTFVGYVRDRSSDGLPVEGLHYEAHRTLALDELRAVGADALARFAIARIAIVHRVGELAIGDAAVGIAVSAAHRGPAFDACEFAIDELKRRVPIWKKERYTGGDSRWRENA